MSASYPVSKLRRALLQFAGGRAAQAVGRALLLLLLVRLLPAADYGAYMLLVGLSEMLLQMGSFGVLAVGQRFLPEVVDRARPRSTRRFVAVMSGLNTLTIAAVVGVLWVFWNPLLEALGFSPDQALRSRPAVAMLLLVPAFRFVADLLEALLEQGRAQTVRALMPLGRVLGVVGLLGFGVEFTLERALILDAVVTALCLAGAWLMLVGRLRHLAEPAVPCPLPIRDMVRHARHMAVVEVVGTAQAPGALRMVVAGSLGIVESGLFAFLQSLQRLVGRYLPGVLLRGLVRPMLISRADRPRGGELVEQGMALLLKANLLTVAAGAVVVGVAGDQILRLASGGTFTDAGDTLLLMFVVLALSAQRQMLEMLAQIVNRTRLLRTSIVLAPVTLAAVWLVAAEGLNAVVLASGVGLALMNAVTIRLLERQTGGYRLDWWGGAATLLPALLAGLVGRLLLDVTGAWVAMGSALVLLAALLCLVKPIAASELNLAERSIGNLARRALQPIARKAAS